MTLLKHKKHSQLIGCLEIGWPNCNVIPLDSNIKNTYHFVIPFCLHFLFSSIASKSISVARAEGYTDWTSRVQSLLVFFFSMLHLSWDQEVKQTITVSHITTQGKDLEVSHRSA